MSIPGIVFLSYFASLTPLFFRLVVTHISTTHTHAILRTSRAPPSAPWVKALSPRWALVCAVMILENPWKILETWEKKPFVGRTIGRLLCFCNAKNLFVSDLLLISGGEAGHSNVTSGVQWGKNSEMDMTPPCGSNPQFWRYLKIHFFKVLRRCGSIIFYNIIYNHASLHDYDYCCSYIYWLVVLTILKNISLWEGLSSILWKITLLRVIPTMTFIDLLLANLLAFYHIWHIFWHSIWHSIWHIFWHILWYIFWHVFWHSIWHIFWQMFWHIFWHSIWHSIWHICWHIIWQIFWDSIWHILWQSIWYFIWHSIWHTFSHSIWHIFWHSIWYIFWHSIWHILWHSIWHISWNFIWHLFWHSIWHSIWHIFWHSYCPLRSSSAHWAGEVPGWGPAVHTALGKSQVEVQRCTLGWAGPRLRSNGAHWAETVPGWGPAVHTELEVKRCTLSWQVPGWGPSAHWAGSKSWQGGSGGGSWCRHGRGETRGGGGGGRGGGGQRAEEEEENNSDKI